MLALFCLAFCQITQNLSIPKKVVLSPFYLKYKPSDFLIVLKVLTLKHTLINCEV